MMRPAGRSGGSSIDFTTTRVSLIWVIVLAGLMYFTKKKVWADSH